MHGDQQDNAEASRVGLIAGWGRYPIVVAEALRAQGRPVVCLGVAGHADPLLREMSDAYSDIGIAKLRHDDVVPGFGVGMYTIRGQRDKQNSG